MQPGAVPSTAFPESPRSPDLARLVQVLDRHGVEYLVVGGVAARAYGATRLTQDLDCLIRRSRANLVQVAEALVELGAHLRVSGMSDEEMAALPVRIDAEALARSDISTWRTAAGDLDVLADIPAQGGKRRSYEDLFPNSNRLSADGVIVVVADLMDVISSKEWANRAKDREALPELHAIADRRRSESPPR